MKIKFPDTGQIIEVTEPSQLANTEFYCRDKSELDFIESLGFREYQGEDPRYKDDFGVTVSLWDDMEYSRSIGFDDTGKPFREFEFLPSLSSPSELQDSKQDDSNTEREEVIDVLSDCILQIEYLHDKFTATGTGNNVLSRARALLQKLEALPSHPKPSTINSKHPEECPFHYCDSNPVCSGGCRHSGPSTSLNPS